MYISIYHIPNNDHVMVMLTFTINLKMAFLIYDLKILKIPTSYYLHQFFLVLKPSLLMFYVRKLTLVIHPLKFPLILDSNMWLGWNYCLHFSKLRLWLDDQKFIFIWLPLLSCILLYVQGIPWVTMLLLDFHLNAKPPYF